MNERISGLVEVSWDLKDQGADDTAPMFKIPALPSGWDVVEVSVGLKSGFTATTANYLTLTIRDGGAAGTGTTVVASRGGKSVAWLTDGVYDLTMASGDPYPIDGSDWLVLLWDEEGTVAAAGTVTVVLAPGQRGTT